jgi:predicted DNA-binding transcriptional regulator YafY
MPDGTPQVRRERLLALVAELRAAAPGPLPVTDLAEALGVSKATIRRDLDDLAAHGLTVRREEGRGYVLDPEPAQPRLDQTTSLAVPIRTTLTEAVRNRRVVRIAYTDQAGRRTLRDVEAQGLVLAPYGEYLVGWCRLREDPRMFRVERIVAAALTDAEAGLRPVDELLAALKVPAPRASSDRSSPARARAWTLDRIHHVRLRLAENAAAVRSSAEGAAGLRSVLGHLAEWSRWQVAALRAVAVGGDLEFDGRRPVFPARFDATALTYLDREKMIQDAMAVRSFGEVARDLDDVLAAAAHWAADCDDSLWAGPLPDPAAPSRRRALADLLAGWQSPLFHIEWHLDRLAEPPDPDEFDQDSPAEHLVLSCPLRA